MKKALLALLLMTCVSLFGVTGWEDKATGVKSASYATEKKALERFAKQFQTQILPGAKQLENVNPQSPDELRDAIKKASQLFTKLASLDDSGCPATFRELHKKYTNTSRKFVDLMGQMGMLIEELLSLSMEDVMSNPEIMNAYQARMEVIEKQGDVYTAELEKLGEQMDKIASEYGVSLDLDMGQITK